MITEPYTISDDVHPGNSDRDEYPARARRKPPRMQTMPLSGRDVQVTITKTIEFDVELHLRGDAPALPPSKIEDEESQTDSAELSNEEQQIRSLELQI